MAEHGSGEIYFANNFTLTVKAAWELDVKYNKEKERYEVFLQETKEDNAGEEIVK